MSLIAPIVTVGVIVWLVKRARDQAARSLEHLKMLCQPSILVGTSTLRRLIRR
jgi:hypothetical protein